MAVYYCVKKSDYSICWRTEISEAPANPDSEVYALIEDTGSLDPLCIKAQSDGVGGIELIESASAADAKWAKLRGLRDGKLVSISDVAFKYMAWADAAGTPWTTQQKQDWAVYRQDLLDAPENETDIVAADLDNYVWPTPPVSPTIPGISN